MCLVAAASQTGSCRRLYRKTRCRTRGGGCWRSSSSWRPLLSLTSEWKTRGRRRRTGGTSAGGEDRWRDTSPISSGEARSGGWRKLRAEHHVSGKTGSKSSQTRYRWRSPPLNRISCQMSGSPTVCWKKTAFVCFKPVFPVLSQNRIFRVSGTFTAYNQCFCFSICLQENGKNFTSRC